MSNENEDLFKDTQFVPTIRQYAILQTMKKDPKYQILASSPKMGVEGDVDVNMLILFTKEGNHHRFILDVDPEGSALSYEEGGTHSTTFNMLLCNYLMNL